MFNNPYNYVRVSELQPVSIESLGILVTVVYFLYLARRRQASLEIAYFLALPFSDEPFRLASSVQPVELLGMILVARNWRKIRLNYVILIGLLYVLFSLSGYALGYGTGLFSILESFKFLLIGLTFSVLLKRDWVLPPAVMRFAVVSAFALTSLQVGLWTAGLPIHGIFYAGLFPRAKGLAHEPATWAIYLLSLFPFVYGFRLGRRYAWLNFLTLLMTVSTFGITAFLTYLTIRWVLAASEGVIVIRRSLVRTVGVTIALGLALAVVKPDVLDSASKLLSVFDKLAAYQQQLVQFRGGSDPLADASGRGADFNYFREQFPPHWLVGIGAFNAPYTNQRIIAGTNLYLIMPVELGVVGTSAFFVLLFLHYRVLLRGRGEKSVDFLAYNLNLLLMVAGIRCFDFSDVWYAQSATLRTRGLLESERREEAAPAPAGAALRSRPEAGPDAGAAQPTA